MLCYLDGQYSSKVKSMCQGLEREPRWLKTTERGQVEPWTKKNSLFWSRNSQRSKKVRVSALGGYDYGYTIESSPWAQKLVTGMAKPKNTETIEPAQAPPAFKREASYPRRTSKGQSWFGWRATTYVYQREHIPQRKRNSPQIPKEEPRCACVNIFRNTRTRPRCC